MVAVEAHEHEAERQCARHNFGAISECQKGVTLFQSSSVAE
jgi:hypothetical protein